ncbi:Uncharacterized conserved protein [Ceraceosorus bombacis]|uniref:Uncharacterized conserved protein n=1 Tax=Ceraceosorus bombacis TaxID=401625 RepID=A0A0P1BS81_9BASI|nr:Uncharacterized conserved protein [Ceraceosorus bombacis]
MEHPARTDLLNRDAVEVQLDALQRRPILGAPEHDPLILYARPGAPSAALDTAKLAPQPPPPVTAMIDAAIDLFAAVYPFQPREIQISSIETLLGYCRSSRLEKNPGRKQAVQLNASACLLGALRVATNSGSRGSRRAAGFNNDRLTQALREILKDALLSGDASLRASAAEAYGRLAAVAGSHAMSAQVQFLVDQVVNNRDPGARAGCARAFGCVYSEVGGLSAGPLTKTIVNILMSLSSDPHPTVHYSAMEALRMVVEAASLSYSSYVSSTLGMLVKLYMLDTHEPEGGSAGSSNLRADLPAHQAACRIISALIGVLGPDLLDSQKVRDLILTLLHEFGLEQSNPGVVVEASKAMQHFALFASEHMDLSVWILELKGHLQSTQRPRKLAAINSFYQLIQRQALVVSRVGGDALVEDLFAQLDDDPTIDGVRQVLLGWLRQTAELSPNSWINLCQRIMSRAVAGDVQAPAKKTQQQPGMLQDEEAAGINLGEEVSANSAALSHSRWRTQLFALQCLHEVFLAVGRAGRLEHFGTPLAAPATGAVQSTATHPAPRVLMSSRVADLIKMAFIASTSATSAIRLEGLTVLSDVIQYFKAARDPDFEESLLLEQHQAPIAAALTPAFSSDSTPEVLAAAVQVCATFVGSGVVREVERMGRILRLLATALERCTDPEMESLGEVSHLSPNAASTLKIATLTAWSELQISTLQQPYLREVIQPHIPTLAPYWIASLRDYAQMRTDPEAAVLAMPQPGPPLNARLDQQYAGLTQEVILPHYNQSWHKILHAVTVLADQANIPMLLALNGEIDLDASADVKPELSPYRDAPATNFHPLFGLAVEALASSANAPSSSAAAPFMEVSAEAQRSRVALYAIRTLSKAHFAGPALLDASVFEELRTLYMRLVMTEPLPIQLNVIEVLLSMIDSYQGRLLDVEPVAGEALPSEAKLTQCLQIIIRVMTHSYLLPGAAEDKIALLRTAYTAFLATSTHFLQGQQESLLVLALSAYSELLHDERQELDLIGPTLPCLKAICERGASVAQPASDVLEKGVHGFMCAALNNIDELRARAGVIIDIKTRNSLLALTVVLTSLPNGVKASTSVIDHFCFLIAQKLHAGADSNIGLTALNCARSIMLASSKGGASFQYAVGLLLPKLVEFVAGEGAKLKQLDDVKAADLPVRLMGEAVKALAAFGLSTPHSYRARVFSIVMPTFILLLSPDEPKALHDVAVAQLLAFATQAGPAFKEVTATLAADHRTVLETSIRNALAASATAGAKSSHPAAPQRTEAKIALRSFG